MDLLDFGLRPLSDYLSEGLKGELRRLAKRRTFEDQQALHRRGDEDARFCLIAAGTVRFGRFQHDGSFKLLAMLGPGAHYGDVALQRQAFTQSVYAVGRTEIDVIDALTLENLLRDQPELAIALWRCNTARLNAAFELYDDARTLNVAARLAKVIYVHAGRGNLANGVSCLQRDLAELLGVSQVAVGKAMRELEREGLLQSGYRQIIVTNKGKLKSWLRRSGAA
jgi:CRP/FNR family cyclic AMP-dependent transcriptional regulator